MLNVFLFVDGDAGVRKETVKVSYRTCTPFNQRSGMLIDFQQLHTHNAKVNLAARSTQKANDLSAELKNKTGHFPAERYLGSSYRP
jgi:hypothetical protein